MTDNLPFELSGPDDASQDFMAGLQTFAADLAGYAIYSGNAAFSIDLNSVAGSWQIPDFIPPEILDASMTAAGLQDLLTTITIPDFSSIFPATIDDAAIPTIVKDILGI